MTSLISWALISFKIFALNYRSLWSTISLDGTAELKLRSYAFPRSSVSIVPSAASRGPLGFFLSPNIASKGLFVAWHFCASLSSFWTSPSRSHFCKCAPFIMIQVPLLPSSVCPFPTGVHLTARKQSHRVVWSVPLSFIIGTLCNCMVIILFTGNWSFIF